MAKKSYTDGKLLIGNCLDTLKTLPDNSIDSVVTDPPYGINFMGKSWDNAAIMAKAVNGVDHTKTTDRSSSMHAGSYDVSLTGNQAFQEWSKAWALEVYRVLKPGGHLLCFSSARTYHRMAAGIEDAGFEIRDQIMWIYGSGFPKSLDVSKAIDKAAGAEREIDNYTGANNKNNVFGKNMGGGVTIQKGKATTKEAKQWQGWGTALKPAHEPIVVARKPISEKTVAENVLTYGTGAINIDASRVGTEQLGGGTLPDLRDVGAMSKEATGIDKLSFGQNPRPATRVEQPSYTGRFPANVIHDGLETEWSKFFYCAKASKSERNAGLDELANTKIVTFQTGNGASGKASSISEGRDTQYKNFHPTVKPLTLMRYLIKLVTPPNGTVLDPFLGSGTTAVAAVLEDFEWKGCEMTDDYLPIIKGRLDWAVKEKKKEQPKLL